MKKEYEALSMEVMMFASEDVITTSNQGGIGGENETERD